MMVKMKRIFHHYTCLFLHLLFCIWKTKKLSKTTHIIQHCSNLCQCVSSFLFISLSLPFTCLLTHIHSFNHSFVQSHTLFSSHKIHFMSAIYIDSYHILKFKHKKNNTNLITTLLFRNEKFVCFPFHFVVVVVID